MVNDLFKHTVFLLALVLVQPHMLAAQSFTLRLRGDTADMQRLHPVPSRFTSFSACHDALQETQQAMFVKGYLAFSIDSLEWNDSSARGRVVVGRAYRWAKLANKNIPSALLLQSGFDEKAYFNQPLAPEKLLPVYEKLLRYYEDNGYPFTSVSLDDIRFHDDSVFAKLNLNTGPLVKIDTVIINEDARISKQYLMHYLGLKQGMLYNESVVRTISPRIRELPFLQESSPWRIAFNVVETKLYLFVKSKSANRADVLIGLLPNNEGRQGKTLLTGDVNLAFVNALGAGENLTVNWQSLQYLSPRYHLDGQLPYVLNSPVGITAKFDFYKRDTSFKNVNGELGLLYQFNANQHLKVYYELASSRLLNVNIPLLLSTRALPELVDVAYKTVGMEGQISRVDYKPNPRKGFRAQANAGISFRKLLRNSTIETTMDPVVNQPFAYLYDSVKIHTYKYSVRGQASYYLPLGKRMVWATTYSGGLTFSTQPLFRNEVFQIGGYRLLRGFDEGSLFVNQYHVLSLEPRFMLSLNSYFFLFNDNGFIQSRYGKVNRQEFAYSAGMGMVFETAAGLFNISYALGGRQDQPMQFRSSKVHFGYVSYF